MVDVDVLGIVVVVVGAGADDVGRVSVVVDDAADIAVADSATSLDGDHRTIAPIKKMSVSAIANLLRKCLIS